MSTENECIADRLFGDFWTKGDLEVADEILASDFRDVDPAAPWVKPGAEGMKDKARVFRGAFPDLVITAENLACGERVVCYWTASGTHQGEVFGLAPTGRHMEVKGISIFSFSDGKMVEQICIWDALGMMRQIGALGESA